MITKVASAGSICALLGALVLSGIVAADAEGLTAAGGGPGTSEWDGSFTYVDFPSGLLENFLEQKYPSSKLTGTMDYLLAACEEADINPAVFLGISFAESSLATARCPAVDTYNNAFGFGYNPAYGMFHGWDSFEESYPEVAGYLRGDCLDMGYDGLLSICGKYVHGVTSSPQDAEQKTMDYMAHAADTTWPERVQMCADAIYAYCSEILGVDVAVVGGMCFPCGASCYFRDDWHEPRTGHLHQGCDIFAPMGSPALAVCDGEITLISRGGNAGLFIRLTRSDGSGDFFYYMHMQSAAVSVGDGVVAGQLIGAVGDSGNAKGGAPHIHFEYHPGGGEAAPPFPLLKKLAETGKYPYVSYWE